MFKKMSGVGVLALALALTACNAPVEEETTTEEPLPIVEEEAPAENTIHDEFLPFVIETEGGNITGFEKDGEIVTVGDGFYTVSQSDGGGITNLGTQGMLEVDGELYFSTYGYEVEKTEAGEMRVGSTIYKYDPETDNATKVFENSNTAEFPTYIRLLGYDTAKEAFIVQVNSLDWSPGPCANNWLFDADWFYTVAKDESGEMMSYVVPQWKLDQEKDEEQACEDEMMSAAE